MFQHLRERTLGWGNVNVVDRICCILFVTQLTQPCPNVYPPKKLEHWNKRAKLLNTLGKTCSNSLEHLGTTPEQATEKPFFIPLDEVNLKIANTASGVL